MNDRAASLQQAPRRLPADFAGAVGSVAKPYAERGMRAALRFVAERLGHGEAARPAPASLELSPSFARRWRAPDFRPSPH